MNKFPSTFGEVIVMIIVVITFCLCIEGITWLIFEILKYITLFYRG